MNPDEEHELPVAVYTSKEWAEPPDLTSNDRTTQGSRRWGLVAVALLGGIAVGWLLASPSAETVEPEVTTTTPVAEREADLSLTDEEVAALIAAQDPVVVPTPELTDLDLALTLAPREVAPGQSFSFWHLSNGQLSVEVSEEALRPFFPKTMTALVDEDDEDTSQLIVTDVRDNSTFGLDRPTTETFVNYSGEISDGGDFVYVSYDISTTALPEPDLVVYEIKSGKAIVKMSAADGIGTVRWIGDERLAFVERVGSQQHLRIFDAKTKQATTVATMTGAVAWAMAIN